MKRPVCDLFRPSTGFTLVEILVVITLIAATVSVAVVRLQRDADSIAEHEARRLVAVTEHIRDEAVLRSRLLGLWLDENRRGYGVVVLDGKEWKPVDDEALIQWQLSEPVSLAVVEDTGVSFEGNPLIIADLTGDLPHFEFDVIGEHHSYRIALDEGQNITLGENRREATP